MKSINDYSKNVIEMRNKIEPLICGDGYDAKARLDNIMKIIQLGFQKMKQDTLRKIDYEREKEKQNGSKVFHERNV